MFMYLFRSLINKMPNAQCNDTKSDICLYLDHFVYCIQVLAKYLLQLDSNILLNLVRYLVRECLLL